MIRPRRWLSFAARMLAAALLALGARSAPVRAQEALEQVLRAHPADSLVVPLRRFENESRRPLEGARAALMLGRLHYARGEYRPAAEAFSRAAARLDPAHKMEARYWMGLSWLALGDAGQARAVFEEIAQQDSTRRTEARLGAALAWEQAHHPERAFEILLPLMHEAQGEIAPAVLERAISVADQLDRPDVASAARQRLFRDFPRSIEAARAGVMPPKSVGAGVELGPFPNEPAAHAAVEQARRMGFPSAEVRVEGVGAARVIFVHFDGFANADEARHAADRLKRELGIPARVTGAP